ncbi:Vacuolar protein sorting-associated protein 41 [Gnomoniopsis smithogilvyi]|uniref:Vacuolar protein sorting-associated protein 41 n=1 Tax=Gnomoniopsis smithogilvyi TaxID=1191159 RepID=A0A9W8YL60_9PEZI|nr:Vacuolar protein sorting-associated protein 41 [Gnomoniopsis smithogilvyi]
MTDPVPGAGDNETNQQSDLRESPVAESPPAADASAIDSAEGAHDQAKEKTANDGASDAAETTEPDSDEEEDDDDDDDDDDGEDEEDEDEEDEEPRLKYARLTQNLAGVYKNADATSSFLVAGDKMIIGTHNGNINVIQLPAFNALRVYHAHSASVTTVSISPYPPPFNTGKPEVAQRAISQAMGNTTSGSSSRPESRQAGPTQAATARKPREMPQVPNIPSNNIYIATSSMDGNVCVQSLVDMKDVQLRNFARPVHAVALSPDYKNDRTYLSGGTAGNLILTVGGGPGRSTSTTVGTAAATASGWLGSMGLGANNGKDTILHSGEGIISTIKWSLTGKYVVWLNEHGIKIMRSHLHLESGDPEDAWKRIGHYDRPQTDEWEAMAGVWKGRVEWIDERSVPTSDGDKDFEELPASPSLAAEKLKLHHEKDRQRIERVLVGWGSNIWILHIHPGGTGTGKKANQRSLGRAEMVKILRMDCIISGISLYTQSLLLVLAYPLHDEDEEDDENLGKKATQGHKPEPSTGSAGSGPSGGLRRRQNHLPPELRLIDLVSQAEIDKDSLSVSRFERLSSNDYHLGVLPQQTASAVVASKGYLEAMAGFGTDVWNVAMMPTKALFSSTASIRSGHSSDAAAGSRAPSIAGTMRSQAPRLMTQSVHPSLAKPGTKIFVHSPYDCILATKRDLSDHLGWLLERHQYQQAWELVDENPDIVAEADNVPDVSSPTTPSRPKPIQSADDFYADSSTGDDAAKQASALAESEKRRIGELWLQQVIDSEEWVRAGQIAGKVLTSSEQWEKWVYVFAHAHKLDDITNYIPIEPMRPPIPSSIYEVVLNHYIKTDKLRLKDLLDRWHPNLFDVNTVTTALENQLKYRDVRPDSVEDGVKGRDWRIVMESVAKLCEANGRHREALRYYIRLQDADSAMRLIKDSHLADAVADDIPSFVSLRVPKGREGEMKITELEEATLEAITLLVDEAQHGLVRPELVVSQLQEKQLELYLFFYLRALFKGEGIQEYEGENRDRLVMESQSLVDGFADLAVHLFAQYDQSILMDFLKTSTSYTFEKAVEECEERSYVPELVYLYSKTGQMKRALYLIIDRLGDVSRAIAFAKELDDPDLWEDLLKYSMDKPRFIHGLLEEVGTAINPITLVRRIPEGLEIEGLREGLKHIMKEHEIQYSISEGVARVLRSEVAAAQATLRSGQRKAIKYEVLVKDNEHVDVQTKDVVPDTVSVKSATTNGTAQGDSKTANDQITTPPAPQKPTKEWKPGHCAAVQCLEPFTEWEMETLVGFACGHVYHLTHLLQVLNPDQPVPDVTDLGYQAQDVDSHSRRRTVNTKVTHARLLRDRVSGCPVCGKGHGLH